MSQCGNMYTSMVLSAKSILVYYNLEFEHFNYILLYQVTRFRENSVPFHIEDKKGVGV